MDKTAGLTLYLVEELSDARLRCDQLKRYVDQAVKLVSKSPAKDHVFEVAGHLVEAIPKTLFLLDKSLQATALAASKMDYEELKEDLRPEKVDDLEKVMEQSRLRLLRRRGVPMITPKQAAAELRHLATSLENNPSEAWRDVAASNIVSLMRKLASTAEEDKEGRFEEGKPADPTKNMSPEEARKWREYNEMYEDKFKEEKGEVIKKVDKDAGRRAAADKWKV